MPPKKEEKHHPAPKHGKDENKKGKDVRRAFEHMSRVHSLQPSTTGAYVEAIGALVMLAQQELTAGHASDAAELLRAAEHLSFASMGGRSSGSKHVKEADLPKDLIKIIREHFEHLAGKAEEHWEHHPERNSTVTAIYEAASKGAAKALRSGNHHEALELQRAAEAIAHVKLHGPGKLKAAPKEKLKPGPTRPQLAAS